MPHDILEKCDRALVAYIVAGQAGTAADVWPAKRSLNKALPCTVCWSHSYETLSEAPYIGTVKVDAFIEVRTSGVIEESEADDEPAEKSMDRVGSTWALFSYSDGQSGEELGKAITEAARSAVQNFTVISARIVGGTQGFNPRNPRQQGQAWVDSLHLELVCCPADVG